MQKQLIFNRFGWYKPQHIKKKEFNTFLIQSITNMIGNFLLHGKIKSAGDVYNSCPAFTVVT